MQSQRQRRQAMKLANKREVDQYIEFLKKEIVKEELPQYEIQHIYERGLGSHTVHVLSECWTEKVATWKNDYFYKTFIRRRNEQREKDYEDILKNRANGILAKFNVPKAVIGNSYSCQPDAKQEKQCKAIAKKMNIMQELIRKHLIGSVKKMMDKNKDELIAVLPTDVCNEICNQEYSKSTDNRFDAIAKASGTSSRNNAENNLDLKQIVVYIAIVSDGMLFVYKRKTSEGESRLHGKWGLIGGHVNESDCVIDTSNSHAKSMKKIIRNAAAREYHEELKNWKGYDKTVKPSDFTIEGFINSNESPVDKHHLGVLVVLRSKVDIEIPKDGARFFYANQNDFVTFSEDADTENWLKIAYKAFSNGWTTE